MKFATYMRHTAASGLANAVLYQTPQSRTVPDNIFNDHDGPTVAELRPFPAYFVSDEDWFILDGAGIDPTGAPVINLIQDFRYADPKHPLHTCLGRRALRICVSDALAEAVRQRANGEVHVIENGIELSEVPTRRPLAAPARVLVAGLKNPEVARALAARLDGLAEIDLLTEPMPRLIFLARMAEASVCVLLPLEQEGFFLPPLEAMALGRCIVTVDCYGNRAYCRPGENCLMPVYDAGALAAAVLALVHDGAQMEQLAAGGLKTAAEHSIEKERAAYHALLARHLGSRS